MSTDDMKATAAHANVKQLEIQKMEVLVKIREQQLQLEKVNADLVRNGVRIDSALNW